MIDKKLPTELIRIICSFLLIGELKQLLLVNKLFNKLNGIELHEEIGFSFSHLEPLRVYVKDSNWLKLAHSFYWNDWVSSSWVMNDKVRLMKMRVISPDAQCSLLPPILFKHVKKLKIRVGDVFNDLSIHNRILELSVNLEYFELAFGRNEFHNDYDKIIKTIREKLPAIRKVKRGGKIYYHKSPSTMGIIEIKL